MRRGIGSHRLAKIAASLGAAAVVASSFVGCIIGGGIEEARDTPYSGRCSVGLEMRISDACEYRDLSMRVADDGELIIDGRIGGIDVGERFDFSPGFPSVRSNSFDGEGSGDLRLRPSVRSQTWSYSFNGEELKIALENKRWRIDELPSPPMTAATTQAASRVGACRLGMRLSVGENCTVPGSSQPFVVNADGSGSLGFMTSGGGINIDSIINGDHINFEAERQPDDTWLINRVGR